MSAPLMHQSLYWVCLCKYISTYFFLTHIPTHKWKLNLYLPLPIPFQIIDVFSCSRVQCMPVLLVRQSSYCVCLCKYISTYFFLTHIPTHKWKLNLYLPLPIPFQIIDVFSCSRVWCMPVLLVHQSLYCVCLCKYISTYFFLTYIPVGVSHGCHCIFFRINPHVSKHHASCLHSVTIPTHKWKLNLYLPLPIPFQILFSRNMQYFYYRSTLKSLGVILGGGLNIKVL